jgi:type I site-specific restriction endonuclease
MDPEHIRRGIRKPRRQLAALRDNADSITARIADWKKAKALIAQRQPAWKTVEGLASHGAALAAAQDARQHVEAIRTQRLLVDATDPLPPLRSGLTEVLRQTLNEAHSAHEVAHNEGLQQLVANPTWQKLTAQQQEKILHDVGIVAPNKPDTASDATILAALDARNLATRKAEADAVSGRVAHALNAAASLLEPKVKAVSVEKALLKSADDVRQWAERQQKSLLEAVEKGPVQVQ